MESDFNWLPSVTRFVLCSVIYRIIFDRGNMKMIQIKVERRRFSSWWWWGWPLMSKLTSKLKRSLGVNNFGWISVGKECFDLDNFEFPGVFSNIAWARGKFWVFNWVGKLISFHLKNSETISTSLRKSTRFFPKEKFNAESFWKEIWFNENFNYLLCRKRISNVNGVVNESQPSSDERIRLQKRRAKKNGCAGEKHFCTSISTHRIN